MRTKEVTRKFVISQRTNLLILVILWLPAVLLDGLNIFALVLISLAPFLFWFKVTKENFLLSIPLLFSLNTAFIIIFNAFLVLLGIKISLLALLYAIFALSVVSITLRARFNNFAFEVGQHDIKIFLFIYFCFSLAVVSRVISTIGVEVPLLHDPISHAFWTQQIIDEGTVDYFYPPGLHILTFYFEQATLLSTAKATHFVTNFLSAFGVVTWSIAAWSITKNKVFTFFVSFLTLIVPLPSALYYIAGKNSSIAALCFFPIAIFSFYTLLTKPGPKNLFIFVVANSAVFFMHYPTSAYLLTFYALSFFTYLFLSIKSGRNVLELLKILAICGLILAAVTGSWLYSKNDQRIERAGDRVSRDVVVEQEGPDRGLIRDLYFTAVETFKDVEGLLRRFNSFLFPVGVISIALLLTFSRDKYFFIGVLGISVFSVVYLIKLVGTSGSSIFISTGQFIQTALFVIGLSGLIVMLWKQARPENLLIYFVVIVIIGFSIYHTKNEYRIFNNYAMHAAVVDSNDVKAFDWIQENVDDKALFLNNAFKSRQTIIFSSDGGGWIPVFTGNEITMPFHDERFSKRQTHEFYNVYQMLDTDFVKGFCALLERDVKYYYHDLRFPKSSFIDVIGNAPEHAFDLLYENEGARIYRFNDDFQECN